MSQNSQENGQPRECCTAIEAYASRSSRSKRGTGESSTSGKPSARYTGFARPRSRSSANVAIAPSASPMKTWSTPLRRSGEMLGYGPPAATGTPSRLQRATTSPSDGACTTIVDVRTTSAHSRSESRSGATFMSISRNSQCSGSMAATVTRPRGGSAARRSMYGSASLKLQ